jgi:hypothetical protein
MQLPENWFNFALFDVKMLKYCLVTKPEALPLCVLFGGNGMGYGFLFFCENRKMRDPTRQ